MHDVVYAHRTWHKPLLLVLLSVLMNWSCREIMPVIPPVGPPELGDRKVLIEEFTGVRCVNCPDGSAEIENLRSLYGDNLVAVSIHAGFFSEPYPENLYDFRTPEGTQLQAYLGEPEGYPTAVINRKQFTGQSSLQTGRSNWAGFIAQESALPPVISIATAATYQSADRLLDIEVTAIPQTAIDFPLYLTLMITENGIEDMQYTNDGLQPDYIHKHVLRKVLSIPTGDPIGNAFASGNPIVRSFSYTLPDTWKAENCRVIAFVHQATGSAKEVLQADETAVVE